MIFFSFGLYNAKHNLKIDYPNQIKRKESNYSPSFFILATTLVAAFSIRAFANAFRATITLTSTLTRNTTRIFYALARLLQTAISHS
jgi:hypothetical protein